MVCIKVQRVQEESKQKYGYNLSGIHPLQPEGIVSLAGKNMIPFAHRPTFPFQAFTGLFSTELLHRVFLPLPRPAAYLAHEQTRIRPRSIQFRALYLFERINCCHALLWWRPSFFGHCRHIFSDIPRTTRFSSKETQK